MVNRDSDQTTEHIESHGWECGQCGHRHTGAALGFICIGCPCERTHPTFAEFDRARQEEFPIEEAAR